ncbi:putative serine/threonine-protein kinase [Dissostichus eleginoides]|uniref:Serine/threonine-protein kinase n=1 Tax=Dissostichus eleginoides TaxID=100907 RepID=A0AAD9BUL2_DISEL|nr:putative serine/threonine-protein kinase [Dissostichus eleginoides]
MSEFRRIMMSSFLMLLLHFPAAAWKPSSFTVRVGDEVTLPSDNVIHDQDECESTVWLFRDSRSQKVTEEDAGSYFCRQFRSGKQQYPVSWVLLSVVTMTEHQVNDEVTLNCSVKTDGGPQSSGDATTTGTPGLLRLIMVSVGLAALIISVVTVHIWTRTKGGKKRMRKNLEQNDEDEDEVNYENDGGASASV